MVRKWTVGTTGFALLATTLVVVACSSKSDDDDNGSGGSGAKGGTSSGSAGKGGSTGGGTMGGSSGTGTGGTMGGTTASGGMGGTTTTGGMGGTAMGGTAGAAAGAAGAMTFDCSMPAAATCNMIVTWNSFSEMSQFQGTYKYQEDSVVLDATTDPTKLHITGMVSNYDGFGIYTGKCSSLMGYTGVTFTLSGTTSSVDKPNAIKFVAQMNATEAVDTMNKKGACVGDPGVDCISPNKAIMPSDTPQTINFADLAGGKPMATLDVTQILGFQWQIDPDASKTPFAIDLTLSNFKLEGGPGGSIDCSAGAAGGGGMGGMAGAAGGAGMAGSGAGMAGGAGMSGGGGMAGMAGMAGGGGMGGANGGMSGMGGRGGRGGAGAGN